MRNTKNGDQEQKNKSDLITSALTPFANQSSDSVTCWCGFNILEYAGSTTIVTAQFDALAEGV